MDLKVRAPVSGRRASTRQRPVFLLLPVLLGGLTLGPSGAWAAEDSILGHWEGAFSRLGSIAIVRLDLSMRDGKLAGTHEIPDIAVFDEPVIGLSYQAPRLTLELKYGVFTLIVNSEDGEMTGENTEWKPPVSLHLKRTLPDPPPPYGRGEMHFQNGDVTLAGTLVTPWTPPPYPALVIVHGSGDQGRSKPYYRFWGEFFARHGIAALIYDKRGVGESTGDFHKATFQDLAGDVNAAVESLKARRDIDAAKIGLFGISQGGWVAPLAASRNLDVKFLILNSGPAVTVQEQELERVEYTMRADDLQEADISQALEYTRLVFDVAYTGRHRSQLDARTNKIRHEKWADHMQLIESDQDLEGWRLSRYDPTDVLRKTKRPILCIFGEKDLLVPPVKNAGRMESLLREAGNSDATIRIIPKVGHDMEAFGTLRGHKWNWPEGYWVWPKKSPTYYETLLQWLSDRSIPSRR